ncbi:HAD-IA family hydrolase [Paenibacillus lycopersici]|uniref:HAD-IA family hydrolase n=1 Tax=Paenibacillus lycopersici TaxID=2704462 RepID=A0A6C0FZF9_9BACL|nr:HAD-IA family hydrolase [Paenibacillus lycopersici]QHT61462.1 HAD-IA family hydrolase [Paenibacillus lycopersici]
MAIRAVFFDLFETLVTEFADGRRLSNRRYDYEKLLGLTEKQFKGEWKLRQERRMNGTFAAFPDVIRDIAAANRLSVEEDAIEMLHQGRLNEKRIPFREIRPDIIALLEALRERGLTIGLISNCTPEEVAAWQDSPLSAHVDDAVFSFEARCSKPDPAIYLLACGRLRVKPDEALFVGDGGSDELEGADRAGLRAYHAFWFNTYIESRFEKLKAPGELLRVVGEGGREAGA